MKTILTTDAAEEIVSMAAYNAFSAVCVEKSATESEIEAIAKGSIPDCLQDRLGVEAGRSVSAAVVAKLEARAAQRAVDALSGHKMGPFVR